MSDKLREIVQLKTGEASMCWKPIPKGVFDSNHALKVADELITQIKAHYESLLDEEWTDYEQCCVGGHDEHNCEENVISKAKYEEHNAVIQEIRERINGLKKGN